MSGIREALSTARFEAYRRRPDDSDVECLQRYVWNVALCEALYPPLQYLEIALRNAVHAAATAAFSTEFWFDEPAVITDPRTLRIISEAKGNISRAGKPIEPGRVVAELHFGFWRHLFYARYEKVLWRPIIKDVFPHAPKSMRTRSALGPRVHEAKELRNRVFHHEPIWHWHDLTAQHHRILETVSWISPPLAELAGLSDRFDEVHTMDMTQLEQHLRRLDI